MERYTDNSKRHVLIIPAWMPSAQDPAAGMFIVDQTIAVHAHGQARVGLIYQDTLEVPVAVQNVLHRAGIAYRIRKISYIPKINSLLIGLWCRQYFKTYRLYVHEHGEPDILHAHSYIAGFAAAYISQQTGIPFVLTEHSTAILAQQVRKTHFSALRNTLSEAAAVIAVGNALKTKLAHWTSRPILQIPNPIDESVFYHDPQFRRDEDFTVICIGSLIPRKRIDLVLKALTSCAQVRLKIVGSGAEEKPLKQLAQLLEVSQRVTWIQFLSAQEIAEELRRSHVLISVSASETFGIVVAEALMCGLPVICTTSGGPEEFMSEQEGIVLSTHAKPKDVAQAILQISDHAYRYDASVIAQKASERFGRKVVIPALMQCYNDVLTRKG